MDKRKIRINSRSEFYQKRKKLKRLQSFIEWWNDTWTSLAIRYFMPDDIKSELEKAMEMRQQMLRHDCTVLKQRILKSRGNNNE